MPKPPNPNLTDKQKETLIALCDYMDEHGFAPSFHELANILGLKYSSLQDRMKWLAKKGYIERDGRVRTIRVLRRLNGPARTRIVSIPVVGTVVAGMPVLAEENREGELLLETTLKDPENCFAVKAQGESMVDVGIGSGDMLVVHKQRMADNGQIVIALLNGESTVKTFQYSDEGVELVPANRRMKPIKINELDDFRIQGVVVTWMKCQ